MLPPAVSAAAPGSQNRMGNLTGSPKGIGETVGVYTTLPLFIIRGSLKRGRFEKAGSETSGQVLDSSVPCLNHSCRGDSGCSRLSLCFY